MSPTLSGARRTRSPEGPAQLDAIFSALAHPARRAMLARLALGPASVTELGAPLEMSQPAVSKNLKVLEQAGLIVRGRDAQWRPCALRPEALELADEWMGAFRQTWEARLDRFGAYLEETRPPEARAGGKSRRSDQTDKE